MSERERLPDPVSLGLAQGMRDRGIDPRNPPPPLELSAEGREDIARRARNERQMVAYRERQGRPLRLYTTECLLCSGSVAVAMPPTFGVGVCGGCGVEHILIVESLGVGGDAAVIVALYEGPVVG